MDFSDPDQVGAFRELVDRLTAGGLIRLEIDAQAGGWWVRPA